MDDTKFTKLGTANGHSPAGLCRRVLRKNLVVGFLAGTIVVLVVLLILMNKQQQAEIERKYDTAVAEMKDEITSLRQQNAVEEEMIDRIRPYMLELESNLTQLRIEHEESIQKLQEGSEADSHLLSRIEFHDLQYRLINETLSHVEEYSKMQDKDISRVLLERHKNITLAVNENGKKDTELRNSFQQQQQRLTESISDVRHKLDALNSKVHTSVHPFEQCQSEQSTCTIGSQGNGRYWKACPTEYFPIDKAGYKTLLRECSYKASAMQNSENLNLFEKDGNIRCDCDVTFPGENSPEHRPVEDLTDATCTLSILRCPTTVTLFS